MDALKQYLYNVYVAIDQFINTLLAGDPRMTISARCGRAIAAGQCVGCRGLCWVLNLFQTNHCARSAAREKDEGKDEVWKWGAP